MRCWGSSAHPRSSRSGRPSSFPRRSQIERCGTCRGRRSQGLPSSCLEGAARLASALSGALHAQFSTLSRPAKGRWSLPSCDDPRRTPEKPREVAQGCPWSQKALPKARHSDGCCRARRAGPPSRSPQPFPSGVSMQRSIGGPMSLASFRTSGHRPSRLRHSPEQNDEWSVQRRYMPLETMKPSGNTDFEI